MQIHERDVIEKEQTAVKYSVYLFLLIDSLL